ncbi:hypothetical protein [Pseudomonas sp. NMI1173_11]|uniref:hypothetical protein n=1 Tax=Pseudomonas sp. NMI1173_11 TaxID=2903145 RepID=UPI001E28A720|nr:hypothetical protein [Pseudomonas sp. NMI1173_11]MCE1004524.1 hypothetical protein [Pseudomonas sp. NMI1173_11]
MRNDGEFMPGLVLPPAYQAALCKRLVDIERASSAANCLIAQARAQGMVECLETLTHGIADGHIERLYVLIEQATTARLLELESLL